jgi:DNA-directed RNA polymerase delta subunit
MQDSIHYPSLVKPAEHAVMQVLEQHGGLMQDQMLYEYFLGENHDPTDPERHYWAFLMTYLFHRTMTTLPKGKRYERGWRLHDARMEFIDKMIDVLHDLMEDTGTPQVFADVYESLQQHPVYQEHGQKLTEPVVLSLLQAANALHKNPYKEYGLRDWGHVQPKRMHDRIYLVLKKSGEPMHFEDIAKEVTQVFGKKAYPPTVHNELILNDEYVLVGRGLYALREWGYKEGIVADIVEDVLRTAGTPMDREAIADEVLKQRLVKRNTILLALTQKDRFQKLPDGRYTIASPQTVAQSA